MGGHPLACSSLRFSVPFVEGHSPSFGRDEEGGWSVCGGRGGGEGGKRHHLIAFREADGGRPIPASREAGVEWEAMCV